MEFSEPAPRKYFCPHCRTVYDKTIQMIIFAEGAAHNAMIISDAPEYANCNNCGGRISMSDIISGKFDRLTEGKKMNGKWVHAYCQACCLLLLL